MNRDVERHKLFNRRSVILLSGQAVLFSALAARGLSAHRFAASDDETLRGGVNLRGARCADGVEEAP